MNEDTVEIIEQLISWHANQVGQLQLIIDQSDADINIDDMTIEAGTPLHKGIVVGVRIALMQLGTLPISLSEKE